MFFVKKKHIYFVIVCVITVLSFFTFSPNYNPAFNSDGAITVLMTYDFQLPHDYYFWGQDRSGSLIPAVAQIFYRIFNFTPVTAVSITHYLFLILGFFCFSQLLKTYFSKIAFCIAWFLPYFLFNDLIWYTIGLQYCLVGISIFMLNKIKDPLSNRQHKKNGLILLFLAVIFLLCIWVSDLSMISIFVLIFIFSLLEIRKYKSKIKSLYFVFFLLTYFISLFTINYLKGFSELKSRGYVSINTLSDSIDALKKVIDSIFFYLTYQSDDIFLSISATLIFIVILFTIYIFVRKKYFLNNFIYLWISFFVVEMFLVFSSLLTSNWVYSNGMGRRYFIGIYIFTTLLVLIFSEWLTIKRKNLIYFQILIIVTVVISAFGNFYHFKYIDPRTTKPLVKIVSEYKTLGKCGIVAEYWRSYVSASANPELIKATPHDKDAVRNYKIINEVFSQPNIYIIKDKWLNEFPDTMNQFGYLLIKDGNQFTMANRILCKYSIIKKPL